MNANLLEVYVYYTYTGVVCNYHQMKLTRVIILLFICGCKGQTKQDVNAYDYYFPMNDTLTSLKYEYEECYTTNGVDSFSKSYLQFGRIEANLFSFNRYDAFKGVISKSVFKRTPDCFKVVDDQYMISGKFYASRLEPNCIYHSDLTKQNRLKQRGTIQGPDFRDNWTDEISYQGLETLEKPFMGQVDCLKFMLIKKSQFSYDDRDHNFTDTTIIYDLKEVGMYKLVTGDSKQRKTITLKKIEKAHNKS